MSLPVCYYYPIPFINVFFNTDALPFTFFKLLIRDIRLVSYQRRRKKNANTQVK